MELVLPHKFPEGATGLFLHPANECQTLGTDALDHFRELVDLFPGQGACRLLCHNGTDAAPGFDGTGKYPKAAVLHIFADVLDLHTVSGIRLIRAKPVHGLCIGQTGQGQGNLSAQHLLKHMMYKALRHLEDILHVYKGHFQVDLGEFRLPVRPEILIPEAPCQLNVPIHACNHQQLLVDLGGLGQSIELARMHPGGNQIIPCPSGVDFIIIGVSISIKSLA